MIGQIAGLSTILRNLKARSEKLGKGVEMGLKIAGLRLQRESQQLVPVDFGVLKNSAFTRHTGKGVKTVVTVGYTAAYALYVHEAVEMKLKGQLRASAKGKPGYRGHYWDPQGRAQAKFLEEPARRMAPEIKNTIKAACRIV